MEPPKPNKRPRRRRVHSVSSSSGQNPNPSSLPSDPVRHQNRIDRLVTRMRSRRRATIHNFISWPLPPEMTTEIFSKLDTKDLMQASAACKMFKECAIQRVCYTNIVLTAKDVTDEIVHKMLLAAGKELRSLKVGCPDESTQSLLSRYCLAPLSNQDGFLGNLLTSLYIYNRGWLNNNSIFNALRHCSNLTDLKIDGLIIYSLDDLIPFLTSKCQHLYLEKPKGSGGSSFGCATSFVTNCPNLASLSLIGFELSEKIACVLLKGLRKLKYLNLSRTVGVNGDFLRDVSKNSVLETLILRNCTAVTESKGRLFLYWILSGHFRFIRYIDLTCERRLPNNRGHCNPPSTPKFSMEELLNARPGLQLVIEFRSFSMNSTFVSSVEIHDDHHHQQH